MLSPTEKIIFAILTLVLMMGIGSTLDKSQIKKLLKNKKPIVLGAMMQSLCLPLISLSLAYYLPLTMYERIGLILMGSTPGGALSNMYSYFSRGNVELSICITIVTTLLAFVLMPLWIFFYIPIISESTQMIQVPYLSIIGSLFFMLIPVLFGMALSNFSKPKAKKLEKLSSVCGVILILYLIFNGVIKNFDELKNTGHYLFIAVCGLQVSGFFIGFSLSKLFNMNLKDSITLSLETGIQNAPLTLTIVIISFTGSVADETLRVPLLYALSTVTLSTTLTLVFRSISSYQKLK